MGTFFGHAIPGTFFFSFALWWTYSVLKRYYGAKRSGEKFTNSASYPSSCAPKVPIEAIIKVVLISIGIIAEFITGFQDGKFVHMMNGHHITMFTFFLLNAIVDISYARKVNWLVPNLDYITGGAGFIVEGFLFAWHLSGRPGIDVQVHTFLLYSIWMCVIGGLLEMCFRNDIRAALIRCWGTLIQGTWFWQMGFILYKPTGWAERNPAWVENDHEQMMIITMMFAWHFGGCLFLILIIAWLVHRRTQYSALPIVSKGYRNSSEFLIDEDSLEDDDDEEGFEYTVAKDVEYSRVPNQENFGIKLEKTSKRQPQSLG